MERFTKCVTQSAITTVLSSVVDFKTGIPTNNLFTTDVKKELNYSEMLCLSVIILLSALIHVVWQYFLYRSPERFRIAAFLFE